MRLSINYNYLNSNEDLKLNIEKIPIIPTPTKNIIFIEIEGRDGSLTKDQGTYKDITIPITFSLSDKNNMKESYRKIKKWLIGEIYDKKLVFNDDLNYFYLVKTCILADIERKIRTMGRFTANFVCEPFQYSLEGLNTITLTTSETMTNPGTYKSLPEITIYGSGDVIFEINGTSFKVNINEYVTINSEMQDVYKGTELKNMSGDYPILAPGTNNISWSGNVTKVDIIPHWRWL